MQGKQHGFLKYHNEFAILYKEIKKKKKNYRNNIIKYQTVIGTENSSYFMPNLKDWQTMNVKGKIVNFFLLLKAIGTP